METSEVSPLCRLVNIGVKINGLFELMGGRLLRGVMFNRGRKASCCQVRMLASVGVLRMLREVLGRDIGI